MPSDASPSHVPTTSSAQGAQGLSRALSAAPDPRRTQHLQGLLEQAAGTDDEGHRRRLHDQVINAYLPAARSIAARYRGRGVEQADLEQLAFLGVVKAVQRWQPGLSEHFLQYAAPTITGEIKRYFRDHSHVVRPTRRVQELRTEIRHAEDAFWQQHGSAPTPGDLAAALNADPDDVREARRAMALCRPGSLDTPLSDGSSAADRYGSTDQHLSNVDDGLTVQRLLGVLDDRERTVVHLRFDREWSQSRIGAEMGVSQMQISRWLRVITTKLHDAAA